MDFITDFFNTLKGKHGEAIIAKQLGWTNILGCRGKILRNVYIPKNDGSATEIDLLFITKKGIFVIESKNYVGYIFGRAADPNWTVSLYRGKDFWGEYIIEKHHFYNPVRQNANHIKWLISYLGAPVPIFSFIVFSDRCELKSIDLTDTENTVVCQAGILPRAIKDIWRDSPSVLNASEIEFYYHSLKALTYPSPDVLNNHIQDVENAKNGVLCPMCGKPLILRTAMKGKYVGQQFWGCTGYPICHYTRNINMP